MILKVQIEVFRLECELVGLIAKCSLVIVRHV